MPNTDDKVEILGHTDTKTLRVDTLDGVISELQKVDELCDFNQFNVEIHKVPKIVEKNGEEMEIDGVYEYLMNVVREKGLY